MRQWRPPEWRKTSQRYDTAIEYNAGDHALLVRLPDCGNVTVIHHPGKYEGRHRDDDNEMCLCDLHGGVFCNGCSLHDPPAGLRCPCGHLVADHRGNYNGSRACDHCSCPAYPLS